MGAVQAGDGDALAGADVLIGIGASAGHRDGLGDRVAVDAAADGVVRVEEIGGGRQTIVDLGDRAGQADRGLGDEGVEHALTGAGGRGRTIGGAILLVVVSEVAVIVAGSRVMRRRVGAPDLPGLAGARVEDRRADIVVEETGVDRDIAGDGDRSVERDRARTSVEGQVIDRGRAGGSLPGDVGSRERHPVGALGAEFDADDALGGGEGDSSVGSGRHQGEGAAVRPREDRVEGVGGVEVEDRTGREGHGAGREDVTGAELIRRASVDGDGLGLEIDDAGHLGRAARLILDGKRAGHRDEGREGAVDERVRRDVAAGGGDGKGIGTAQVAIEDDGTAAGGDRTVGAVDAEVSGVSDAIEDASEVQPKLVGRGRDVAAEQDGRGEEAERGVAGTGVVEIDHEVDGSGGLQVDVGRSKGVAQGGDADLGDAGGRQAGDGASGPVDDLDGGRIEQPGAVLAGGGRGADGEAVAEDDLRGGGLDEAAVAGHGGAGVEAAVSYERTVREVAEEDDAALLAGGEGAGFDHAVMVDCGGGELISRAGGEENATTVGADGAAVVDHGLQGAAFDREADEAAHVQGDAVAGAEEHLAAIGGEDAVVDDLRGEQGDDAAAAVADRGEAAVVGDDARAGSVEYVITYEEIVVADRERGSDQAADVDLRAGVEEDTVGIDQEDITVGGERAADHGSLGARHAVEHDGRSIRLPELHRVAGADREALPVDDRLGGGLVDGHRRPLGRDRRRARGDIGSGRQIRCR